MVLTTMVYRVKGVKANSQSASSMNVLVNKFYTYLYVYILLSSLIMKEHTGTEACNRQHLL